MATLGSSKNNVMAIVTEVTEGTPVDPASSADFVTLQSDASFTPSFETLQNDEIRASIGRPKTVQGLEQPESSFSHYIKHSGVEGQSPEIDNLLESAFGSKIVNSTERETAVGSTLKVLSVTTGASDFERGTAVMVKNGAGFEIRPVDAVAGTSVTLGFPLHNAPAAGVKLGKCVNFSPANAGHKPLTVHMYRGNGQAYEMLSGGKVTSFSMSASAGEFINGSFSLVGSKYFFNPVRVSGTTRFIDFTDGTDTFSASVAVDVYRDPFELAQALQDAMRTAADSTDYSVEFQTVTGKFTLTKASGTFSVLFATGDNTANNVSSKLGFAGTDLTGALSYIADDVLDYSAPFQPAYDAADPLVAKNQEIILGDANDNAIFDASSVDVSFSNSRSTVRSIASVSGVKQNIITGREVSVSITALLDKHDADKFRRFRSNADTKFMYAFGNKSGGNWIPGQCGCIYLPTCTISSFTLTDLDSVIGLQIELSGFVDSNGSGEVYLNFL